MFKTFVIYSRRLLVPKPVLAVACTTEQSAVPTIIYDARQNKEYHRTLLSASTSKLQPQLMLRHDMRWARQATSGMSDKSSFQMNAPAELVCNMINMLKCVDFNDLKDAPPEAFWVSILVGGSQLVVPFLEVIGGYSPVMTLYQVHAAAVTLGFYGGMKWGLALSINPMPKLTWETMRWSLLPPVLAVTGLMLPYPLGFLTLGSGMITSLYLDLKSCAYPPWASALALFMTLTTVTGLLLGLAAYVMFHNRENNKKKVKDKEDGGDDAENADVNGDKEKNP